MNLKKENRELHRTLDKLRPPQDVKLPPRRHQNIKN